MTFKTVLAITALAALTACGGGGNGGTGGGGSGGGTGNGGAGSGAGGPNAEYRIVIGGLPFIVDEASRARGAVLVGLQYVRWQSYSTAPAARLTFAQAYAAEVEPTYGFHHLAVDARACAEQPVAAWTWVDACLTGSFDDDSVESATILTGSLSARRLFDSPIGLHEGALRIERAATGDYEKSLAHLTLATLTERLGLVRLGLGWGEEIAGENTLRRAASVEWTGRIAGQGLMLGASHARTGGGSVFGIARTDDILRLSVTLLGERMDIGGFVERRRSTISAWDDTSLGLTLRIRANLLRGG